MKTAVRITNLLIVLLAIVTMQSQMFEVRNSIAWSIVFFSFGLIIEFAIQNARSHYSWRDEAVDSVHSSNSPQPHPISSSKAA
ncbi:MAG: hypothetical protein MI748_05160 [Opitutales bacterium]|nr:hypothetical protein [Opitutales bacterium]